MMKYFGINKKKPLQWVITYREDTEEAQKNGYKYIKVTIPTNTWKQDSDYFKTKRDAINFIHDFLK